MASITFFLKQPNQQAPTPIIARLAHGGKKTKIYIGISVEPKRWSQLTQQLVTRGFPQGGRLNDALAALRTSLENCFLDHVAAGTLPTPEQLRQAIEPAVPAPLPAAVPAFSAPASPTPGATFWAAFQAWQDERRGRMSPATIQTYRTAGNHLTSFAKSTGYPVDFTTLTPAFESQFTNYLVTVPRLTDNSVAKVLARLMSFLRFAHERGFVDRAKVVTLKWQKQEPDIMTLSLVELQAVEQLALPTGRSLANARDLFLLACYTGLRYSDLVSLRPEHLQGDRLRLRMKKTRDLVTIPLRPAARALLLRLFAGELHAVTNQKLNNMLKEIGQLAGLDAPVERVRYRAGQRQTETFKKYERLSCHTARRTFVTLSLEARIRPEVVMRVSGHRSWQSFRRYISISEQVVEQEFAAVYGGGVAAGEA